VCAIVSAVVIPGRRKANIGSRVACSEVPRVKVPAVLGGVRLKQSTVGDYDEDDTEDLDDKLDSMYASRYGLGALCGVAHSDESDESDDDCDNGGNLGASYQSDMRMQTPTEISFTMSSANAETV
jgi:hypothetical protein